MGQSQLTHRIIDPMLCLLAEKCRNVPRTVKDADDLQRIGLGVVHDDVIGIGLDCPEPKRMSGQILAGMPAQRTFGEQIASLVNGFLDSIGCLKVVAGDLTPDFKEIASGLRRELVAAHP
jgi:hypothetical protein